jgi:hypothetical protein
VVSTLVIGFLLAQSVASLPAFPVGTELRLVSPDLLTVYSSGRVTEGGHLVVDLPLDAGTEVRLLVFPPDASDAEKAEALSGVRAIYGRVADDRSDVLVRFPEADDAVSLRAWLRDERGIDLVLVTRR